MAIVVNECGVRTSWVGRWVFVVVIAVRPVTEGPLSGPRIHKMRDPGASL
jgi:hypothetical protein